MSEQEELFRKICDKRTFDALCLLKSVNKDKGKAVEKRIFAFYEMNRKPIDFDNYLELVKGIDTEQNICFQRKNDCFDLDEITDI